MSEFLFVYGTLTRSCGGIMHQRLAADASYVGPGYVRGQLYAIGRYPGLIESTARRDRVTGEVYRLDPHGLLMRQLDDYEGCSARFRRPWEYHRKQRVVRLGSGERLQAWTYVYNWSVANCRRIACFPETTSGRSRFAGRQTRAPASIAHRSA